MAAVTSPRVFELSTTTGTGNFTLAGAPTGFVAFSTVCATNDILRYVIEGVANGVQTGEWEVGTGTYSAANTLTRTVIEASSNAGAAVNFSAGTKRVSLIDRSGFRGALVKKAADQTTANYTTEAAIAWDATSYDRGDWHSEVTNNTRLTVPAGVDLVRAWGHVRVTSATDADYHILGVRKNGSLAYDGATRMGTAFTGTSVEVAIVTPVLEVVPTDYFELMLFIESDVSVTIAADRSSFGIEAVY